VTAPLPFDEPALCSEPLRTGDERTTLVEFLEYYRSVFVRKPAGVDAAGLARTIAASKLTLGGLLKHMALVEDHWFHHTWGGGEMPQPWADIDWDRTPDWEFDTAHDSTPAELEALWTAAVERSRASIAAATDLDAVAAVESEAFGPATLRWIVVHMIEEYARHCGHADLLREAVDGRTGD
jgi:uncharacterized damage-inducible protein DinB